VGKDLPTIQRLGQHHEAGPVVAAFLDRQDQCERGEAGVDEAAGVATGSGQFQPVL
jgi:hypothetical protein